MGKYANICEKKRIRLNWRHNLSSKCDSNDSTNSAVDLLLCPPVLPCTRPLLNIMQMQ